MTRWTLAVMTLMVATLPRDVHAYIDPGSGALLLQAALSGLFGALFLARNFVRRAFGRLRGGRGVDTGSSGTETSSEPTRT